MQFMVYGMISISHHCCNRGAVRVLGQTGKCRQEIPTGELKSGNLRAGPVMRAGKVAFSGGASGSLERSAGRPCGGRLRGRCRGRFPGRCCGRFPGQGAGRSPPGSDNRSRRVCDAVNSARTFFQFVDEAGTLERDRRRHGERSDDLGFFFNEFGAAIS